MDSSYARYANPATVVPTKGFPTTRPTSDDGGWGWGVEEEEGGDEDGGGGEVVAWFGLLLC